MSLRLCGLIPLLLLFSSSLCQNSETKTNLSIFEESIWTRLEKLIYYPGINRDAYFVFEINSLQSPPENVVKFMNALVKKFAEANKLKFGFASKLPGMDSNYNLVSLKIHTLKTFYPGFKKNTFLGEKTLIRNIRIEVGVEITSAGGGINLKDSITTDYKDEILFDDYRQLESSQYDFTSGIAPETGIIERVIFPASLITASAAVIILFFTIRTK